jgi:hypothetical protein
MGVIVDSGILIAAAPRAEDPLYPSLGQPGSPTTGLGRRGGTPEVSAPNNYGGLKARHIALTMRDPNPESIAGSTWIIISPKCRKPDPAQSNESVLVKQICSKPFVSSHMSLR